MSLETFLVSFKCIVYSVLLSDAFKSMFEGDIVLSPFDLTFVDRREEGDVDGELAPSRQKRNADRNKMFLWHDRTVPYKFDPGLPGEIGSILFLFVLCLAQGLQRSMDSQLCLQLNKCQLKFLSEE